MQAVSGDLARLPLGPMIVSPEDVRVYLNLSALSAGQTSAASAIIDGLEADAEEFFRRPVRIGTFTEAPPVRPNYDGRLRFRKTPVLSISAFSVDGDPVTADYYNMTAWGVEDLRLVPGSSLTSPPVLSVTYAAGLDGEDPEGDFGKPFRSKLLRASARVFAKVVKDDAIGVEDLSTEGYRARYVAGGEFWLQGELDSMSRWRRR